MANSSAQSAIDPALFAQLQKKIDEDSQVRQEIRDIMTVWERTQRQTLSHLSYVHSTLRPEDSPILRQTIDSMQHQKVCIQKLRQTVSGHPYWKYNMMWTREMQNACFGLILCHWISHGALITLEQVGAFYSVPVNLKNEDAFHITIEEYLHGLVNMSEELARLALNAVTLGDYKRPIQISKFVKDLHAGFQLLNLKNDSLRRRVDSIKYQVKKIEDVVYDLSLRKLVPRDSDPA